MKSFPVQPKCVSIICNPFAGKGLATKMATKAERLAHKKGWIISCNHQSQYAGHIENELAYQAAKISDLIILIGGDGTLRELIAGLRKHHLITEIAFIPMGNANVVARELNIPLQPELALKMLGASQVISVDIGVLNMTPNSDKHSEKQSAIIFLAMLEIGFGAKIVHLVNQLRLGKLQRLYQLWGDLVYAIAGMMAIFQKETQLVKIKLNKENYLSSHIIISNMTTYAKGWSLTPEAYCQDGLLDIALSKKNSLLATIATFLLATKKKKSPSNRMNYAQGTEVFLEGPQQVFMQVDGDPVHFSGSAQISIEPSAFNIHIPLNKLKPTG